jgi:hypothetical protein
VLAAAGLGCLAGLAIGAPGPDRVGVVRAAGTQTLAYPLPKPSGATGSSVVTSMPGPTTITATGLIPKPPTARKPPKSKVTSRTPSAHGKAYPLPKPKRTGGASSKSSAKGSGSGFSLGEGPRGPAGPVGADGPAGPAGPKGPAGPLSNVVRSLTINWRYGASGVDPTATTTLPGLGTARLTCTPSAQTLTITPATAGSRTVFAADTAQGAGTLGATSFVRATSQSPGAPITVAVPNNGMIFGTLSIEPVSGTGGAGPDPATMTLSSTWKLNDPNPVNNFCFVAAQFVGRS